MSGLRSWTSCAYQEAWFRDSSCLLCILYSLFPLHRTPWCSLANSRMALPTRTHYRAMHGEYTSCFMRGVCCAFDAVIGAMCAQFLVNRARPMSLLIHCTTAWPTEATFMLQHTKAVVFIVPSQAILRTAHACSPCTPQTNDARQRAFPNACLIKGVPNKAAQPDACTLSPAQTNVSARPKTHSRAKTYKHTMVALLSTTPELSSLHLPYQNCQYMVT